MFDKIGVGKKIALGYALMGLIVRFGRPIWGIIGKARALGLKRAYVSRTRQQSHIDPVRNQIRFLRLRKRTRLTDKEGRNRALQIELHSGLSEKRNLSTKELKGTHHV